VDVDGALVALVLVARDALDELGPREDPARRAEEEAQELELGRGQADLPPLLGHPALGGVELDPAVGQDLPAGRLAAPAPAAAEDGPDPGAELAQAEGLGQVVVGPDLEAEELVRLGVPRGQHDDGDLAPRPDPARRLDPVEPRQVEVEDEEVEALPRGELDRLGAGEGLGHLVAEGGEVIAQDLVQLALVLDHEDPFHAAPLYALAAAPQRPQPTQSGQPPRPSFFCSPWDSPPRFMPGPCPPSPPAGREPRAGIDAEAR